jgi:hypothetical protein
MVQYLSSASHFFYKFFATVNLKQTSWAWHQSIIKIYLGDMFLYGPVSSLLSPIFWSNYSCPNSQREKQINMMLKFCYRGDRTHDLTVRARSTKAVEHRSIHLNYPLMIRATQEYTSTHTEKVEQVTVLNNQSRTHIRCNFTSTFIIEIRNY